MCNQYTTLVRSTMAAALLSALVLAQPAHAGLLGGGGSLGGGLGGSLGGSFGPRGVDFGGQAAGHVSREGSLLPRGDKALQKTGDTTRQADGLGMSAAARATGSTSAATRQAGAVQQSAAVTAGEQALLARERAAAVSGSAAGTAAAGAEMSRQASHHTPHHTSHQAAGQATQAAVQAGGAGMVAGRTPAVAAPSPALPAAVGGAGEAGATSGMLDTSARGSAQASRTGRSASVDAAAEGAVRR